MLITDRQFSNSQRNWGSCVALYSVARFCGALDERTGAFDGSAVAYIVNAVSISIGGFFGTSPVTAFIESGAGISEGGKTGIIATGHGDGIPHLSFFRTHICI